jgi:hypothetical protein
MEAYTKIYQTTNGPVEGIQTRWPGFSVLMVTKVDEKARALGIHEGMEAIEAFALIA